MKWCALFLAACGTDHVSAGPDGGACAPHAAVSFHTDVAPLINHCGSENCHGGIGASWPYHTLISATSNECPDARPIVRPGDPGGSYILHKLAGDATMCDSRRMPIGGPYFTAAEIVVISAWICQGAPNN
jgi:hypothetical protein